MNLAWGRFTGHTRQAVTPHAVSLHSDVCPSSSAKLERYIVKDNLRNQNVTLENIHLLQKKAVKEERQKRHGMFTQQILKLPT